MKNQRGFTLIELVVVIVILGLLAAVALPKFIDVTTNARAASVQGVAGGLRSAVALAQAQYVVNGNKNATTVTMSGSTVNVLTEAANAGKGGRPTCADISVAMPNPDGFTITANCGVATPNVVYQPTSGGSSTCQVVYTPTGSPDPVVVGNAGVLTC